ncbi:Uncharacterised protein [Vibrio cholerae]|nr:Uncharacterised protein [Vibrio cholerae]CSI05816.1 Uncharacterised protein [Vibrio cholerae]
MHQFCGGIGQRLWCWIRTNLNQGLSLLNMLPFTHINFTDNTVDLRFNCHRM